MWKNAQKNAPIIGADAPVSSTLSSQKSQLGSPDPIQKMVSSISGDLSSLVKQEQMQLKAELAQKAREWCMKDLNHDLRTPLNAIIGFTQMMENGTLGNIENPQYIEYLRHIRESGYQLLGKFEALMDTVNHEQAQHAQTQQASALKEAVA